MRLAIFISLLITCKVAVFGQVPRLIDIDRANDQVAELVAQFEDLVTKGDFDAAILAAQRYLEDHLDQRRTGGAETWQVIPCPGENDLFLESSYLVTRRLASASPELAKRYAAILSDRAQVDFDKRRVLGPINALMSHRRFPLTVVGLQALEDAAHAALESGRFQLAAGLFGDLIDLDWRASADKQATRQAALSLASSRNGCVLVSESQANGKTLRLGNRQLGLVELQTLLQQETTAALATAKHEQRPRSLEEVWQHSLPGGEIDNSAPLLPEPQAWEGLLIYHDRGGVEAIKQSDGSLSWERTFGGSEDESIGAEMDDPDLTRLGSTLSQGRYFFVHASLGKDRKALRQLVAISAATGKTIWTFDPETLQGDLEDLYLDPNPLAAEDRVYLTAWDRSTTPRCHLLILSADQGQLLSVSRLPPGVPLAFEDSAGNPTSSRHWFSALRPQLVQGFVVICDNLGQIAALNADSGEPRFLMKYERRRGQDSAISGSGGLPRGFEKAPILVCGDRIVVAPDDADALTALFLRPAADPERREKNLLLQRAATIRRDGLVSLIGFDGQMVVAQGRDSAENLDVIRRFQVFRSSTSGPSWSSPIDSGMLGCGFLDQKSVYLCTHKYVYGIDLSQGAVFGPMVSREADGAERLGNLKSVGNLIFVASRRGIQAFRPVW